MDELPDTITIVEMNASHIEALAQLERQCFSSPWSYEALAEELSNPLAAFFVAECAGAPVGYAGMNHVLDEGYIDNIAVLPEFRRQGVATALLRRLDAFARENGLATLSLEARVSNREAVRIYKKAGYREQGVRPGFYQNPAEDALILTKYF